MRKQLNISLDEVTYNALVKAAGSVPRSRFAAGLIEHVLASGAPRQPEPQLKLNRPERVEIDPTPLLGVLAELRQDLHEVLRVQHLYGAWLMARAPAQKGYHGTEYMKARDEAQRQVNAYTGQTNGSGT